MLIRKNTKAFKTILEIVSACQSRPDRENLIRLYITKAGHTIKDRISVEGIQGEAGLFYEMNYQAVLNNLRSSNHQLQVSEDLPGIYYFHSTSNKVWDETPFEFDEEIVKEFNSLPDLPAVRKKEKAEKYVIPAAQVKSDATPVKKKKSDAPKKPVMVVVKDSKQPDFKLKHHIEFTDLDKIIFRQAKLSKEDVLTYYNNVAEHILPHLKDRPIHARHYTQEKLAPAQVTLDVLTGSGEPLPGWLAAGGSKGNGKTRAFVCNDREHLLYLVEKGFVEFHTPLSRSKSLSAPDYSILTIDSSESDLDKAIEVALAAKEILQGLKLASFVNTDGISSLQIYIPLDSKSDFEVSKGVAEYICRLVEIKVRDLVNIKNVQEHIYGRILLDFSMNEEDRSVIAPYSLVTGQAATVAAPLLWDEINDQFRMDDLKPEVILKRLKEAGNSFQTLLKRKINAGELFKRLHDNYSFLVG
jgi:DNA ligase D-like protein (predicted polymerase)